MKRGFTLIELAVVLVIIGLIVGGVLVGVDMIRQSEMRSITTQYHSYLAAVSAFRNKYNGIPGDIATATNYWGLADAANCRTTTTNDIRTCNGDGNLIINYSGVNTRGNELYRFWQHLSNAGLIAGTFTGIAGPNNANYNSVITTNVPSARPGKVGWSLYSYPFMSHSQIPNLNVYANRFWVGTATTNEWTYGGAFTPLEVRDIDLKLDDGQPMVGNVKIMRYDLCTNAANGADSTATYNTLYTQNQCSIIFDNKGQF